MLDVLSNALGGLILLMLIVAVTLKGNDKRRLNIPEEERQGQIYTVLPFEKKKPEIKFNLLLVQIKLYGTNVYLELEGDASNCSLMRRTTEGINENNNWLILRTGEKENNWLVSYADNTFGNIYYPDSIAVTITVDEAIICAEVITDIDENEPILEVTETKNFNPQIRIAGKISCP